jgi:hypothetical protein
LALWTMRVQGSRAWWHPRNPNALDSETGLWVRGQPGPLSTMLSGGDIVMPSLQSLQTFKGWLSLAECLSSFSGMRKCHRLSSSYTRRVLFTALKAGRDKSIFSHWWGSTLASWMADIWLCPHRQIGQKSCLGSFHRGINRLHSRLLVTSQMPHIPDIIIRMAT